MEEAEQLGYVGAVVPATWITDIVEIDLYDRLRPATLLTAPVWDAKLD